jgi:pimeloyl-ACP methyl ester carboxylesterase
VFVHGSGSSRHSPRNRFVARTLREAGFATLLFDLLTRDEDTVTSARFDIPRLATRLDEVLDWVARQPGLGGLPLGLFGASTGSAAALVAAAERNDVRAVVSRGGRPDLAGSAALRDVRAPTLLVVGGADVEVLALNRDALEHLGGTARLVVVPGAGHLFEERGTLAEAARHATAWFEQHASLASTTRHVRDAGASRVSDSEGGRDLPSRR